MRSDELYLRDIVEAAETIERFLAGIDRKTFLADEMRQSAVLHKLIVIGEAVARLSKSFRESHPDIEWRDVVGFRNFAVHAYFSISFPIVWVTATKDAPALHKRVSEILAQEYGGATDESE